MKKLVQIWTTVVFVSLSFGYATINAEDVGASEIISLTSDYCEGWEDGYCEGWKDVKGQFAICPITPICPIAEIDCNEGYRCGYNRGFKQGMKDANDK